MALFKKKKRKDINYLELTPYPLYNHQVKEDGQIDVLVPKFTDKLFSKMLMSRLNKPYIKANLDEFGTAVWKLLNGENKVQEIGEKLLEQFGDKIQPVYDRLTKFLTELYHNGFISFNEFKERKK